LTVVAELCSVRAQIALEGTVGVVAQILICAVIRLLETLVDIYTCVVRSHKTEPRFAHADAAAIALTLPETLADGCAGGADVARGSRPAQIANTRRGVVAVPVAAACGSVAAILARGAIIINRAGVARRSRPAQIANARRSVVAVPVAAACGSVAAILARGAIIINRADVARRSRPAQIAHARRSVVAVPVAVACGSVATINTIRAVVGWRTDVAIISGPRSSAVATSRRITVSMGRVACYGVAAICAVRAVVVWQTGLARRRRKADVANA